MTALAAPYLAITSTAGRSSMITRRSRSAAAWRWSARLANLWAWSAPLVLNAAANPLERRSVLPTVMLRRTNTRRARSRSSRPSGVRSKSRGWAGHQPLVLPRQWQAGQGPRSRAAVTWAWSTSRWVPHQLHMNALEVDQAHVTAARDLGP